jgi:hypothetical protein
MGQELEDDVLVLRDLVLFFALDTSSRLEDTELKISCTIYKEKSIQKNMKDNMKNKVESQRGISMYNVKKARIQNLPTPQTCHG